ncbi:hypothetical protein IQ231_09515 [Cuspidothrix issatschenkoi LEGE 03284]|jgi:hypothetical protein|uniref:hypothetical protein n=1 Tax=Cuspidothrix issatschenkoi TaxID=230752 RepID=UPI00187E4068|nr:hypothetical protein [Cuspidothrix issatschenkoi]MBE9231920.1 hypothetical protein [Cuspidothrix issatschenkoi LEGE 03284]
MTEERQTQYFNLIDELLQCPNGQEPDVLEAQPELIDSGLVQAMLQVATMFAHQGNQDGAQFLFFVAKQLAKQLGLYPEVPNAVVNQE